MSEKLIKELEEKAYDYCKQFTAVSRRPSRFIQMLDEYGALASIKMLLDKSKISEGFEDLWYINELRLSMEALILENPQFQCLFEKEQIKTAERRLKNCNYTLNIKSS